MRIKPPYLCRVGRAETDIIRNRQAAVIHFGQHQRHLDLDSGYAGLHTPNVILDFLLARVRTMIRCDEIEGAVGQSRPKLFLMMRFANRWIYPDHASNSIIVRGVEQEVMRASFASDVDTARLGFPQ